MPTTMRDHLASIPSTVRPIVRAARAAVRSIAPGAKEVLYQSSAPRSRSAMWKLARYRLGDEDVVGIGTFREHSSIFFYRGRELTDDDALLKGGGKDTRFVTLRTAADAKSRAVQRLLREAFRVAMESGGPTRGATTSL